MMKTIFRIFVILLAGLLISGALYLTIENTSLLSDTANRAERPAGEMTGSLMRPEGGDHHNSASLIRGLSQVGASLAKLAGITLLVLLIQALIARLPHWRKARPLIG